MEKSNFDHERKRKRERGGAEKKSSGGEREIVHRAQDFKVELLSFLVSQTAHPSRELSAAETSFGED